LAILELLFVKRERELSSSLTESRDALKEEGWPSYLIASTLSSTSIII
jgi:hypothetical protein